MNFISPQELYAHLAEIVDDEEFILRTVRVHFPNYKRELRKASRPGVVRRFIHDDAVRPMPDPYGVQSRAQQDAIMKRGSVELLRALHREHPRAMQAAIDSGRLVVMP